MQPFQFFPSIQTQTDEMEHGTPNHGVSSRAWKPQPFIRNERGTTVAASFRNNVSQGFCCTQDLMAATESQTRIQRVLTNIDWNSRQNFRSKQASRVLRKTVRSSMQSPQNCNIKTKNIISSLSRRNTPQPPARFALKINTGIARIFIPDYFSPFHMFSI